ncbi:MAG: CHAT domain-containing protein, partial [Spirulinaceae cyanobacterium]
NYQLELILVTASGEVIRRPLPNTTKAEVIRQAKHFRRTITNPFREAAYIKPGQQFYQWLVAPLEADLQEREIDNLVFILDEGLRGVPLAAMLDGNQFVIEKYSVGLMPSLSLTDTNYVDVKKLKVLAMGADTFTEQNPLPAVPKELSLITKQLWSGKSYLNENFTLKNLKQARNQDPFGIIHLATHGEFKPGEPSNSYIQLWEQKLSLDSLRTLDWNNPSVELLVLSACRTALGSREAELGFAGLAVQAGVKSALGSLWTVSDDGTLGLMSSFYQQLKTAPIKAEALRQAQLTMLRGEVYLEDGQLVSGDRRIALPDALADLGDQDLTHPYYWSGFTMIGNPW